MLFSVIFFKHPFQIFLYNIFQETQKHFNSIESPLKTEGSSDSLDGTKYIKNSREFFLFEPFGNIREYVWRSFVFSQGKKNGLREVDYL